MSKVKYSTICAECGKLIKRANVLSNPFCSVCSQQKNNSQPTTDFKKSFEVKLDKPEQKLAALDTVGEVFRHHGGSSLMLTEHIENGIDAVEDLVKIENLTSYVGSIDILLDSKKNRIIIIDNGTGILDPIWIMENPLRSRKTGLDHQHGEFGRGLQGFRGFCRSLEYITLRKEVSHEELSDVDIKLGLKQAGKKGIDGRCVRLKLSKNTVETDYVPVHENEFKKYSKHQTGTVVIFSDWLEGDFENIKTNRKKLFERIQHHFRVVLEKNVAKITLIEDGKIIAIKPRDFSINDDEMDLFELPDIKAINSDTKEEYGTIQFRFFKAAPKYNHTYKSVFLLVGDRPLGNSELIRLEEFSDEKILKSPYITGYVVANFLKPDSLRLSPKPGPEYYTFIKYMRSALFDLKPLLAEYEEGFRVVNKNEENQKLILQVQSFLKNQKVPLNLLDMGKAGELLPGADSGEKKAERVSSIDGEENEGRITPTGTIETVILYKKEKHEPPDSTKKKKKRRYKVKIRDPKKVNDPKGDGRSTKTVYINPNLTSKDGRIIRRNYVGPGLDNYRGELDPYLTKWDGSKYLVLVNELHEIYEMYEDHRKSSSHKNDVYSPKQKSLIQESYLRHVINHCTKELDPDEKDKLFWELKYKFFLNR